MSIDNLARLTSSPWGWVVAAVALLLVWETAKKWVPELVARLLGWLATRLAGTRVVRARALREYRERVALRYASLPVLFMPDEGLDAAKVYVPLRTSEQTDAGADAYERLKSARRAVVLGRPGAGKTMLLRHSMLTWARDTTWRRGQKVPVLLELHRFADTPEQQIIAQFSEDGFARPERFVARALRDGSLSVLFDGLDEVASAERARVAGHLRAFAARYPECQVVVTCRTAIYDQDLAPEITARFHIADFDDRAIRRFLTQWPGIPDALDAERLMAALRDAPRIMQLAQNPLLLTMIAYLYGGKDETRIVLPHSRAEFYGEVTDILLRRLKDSRNQFKGPQKKALLKHLALAAQAVPANAVDRRTLRYEDVLAEITRVSPTIGVKESDANQVLEEIVDRSGLLLRLDGGSAYMFAHLSLQEYLAAVAYEQNPTALLDAYRANPADWREVVKLWCGAVSANAGPLIAEIFEDDQVLAFECLADAQVVNDEVATMVTAHFTALFVANSDLDAATMAAFGLVAAVPNDRGRRVFQFLEGRSGPSACRALAATKLPRAAKILVNRLPDADARAALVSMGDLAVPLLGAEAEVDLLAEIGTPAAALVLAPMLWRPQAHRVAWHFMWLLRIPEIEAALADAELPADADTPDMAWVWAPFQDRSPRTAGVVAARVALLCGGATDLDIDVVDPRLAIPLLTLADGLVRPVMLLGLVSRAIRVSEHPEPSGWYAALRSYWHVESAPDRDTLAAVEEIALNAVDGHRGAALYQRIPSRLRLLLLAAAANDLRFTRQDWREFPAATAAAAAESGPRLPIALVVPAWTGLVAIVVLSTLGLAPGWALGAAAAVIGLWFLSTTFRREARTGRFSRNPYVVIMAATEVHDLGRTSVIAR
ncbi:NACHT domain-containing protein [Actinokineospora diospyrosa]|uniref:NACHT domain-containing protein n=1 Tax=Actinokineospora diospyrosa TaxID=103728 RepID=A0ABT1IA29_9PSEU|nr:NACHT domain-containing protein [Actinokineospora diospyrosa]MCP2269484.1 NACHT domain-containing protein [Actinokineospora diospyrosa]